MISVFDLFKIGIGPSSSHTMGPMKAAAAFMAGLDAQQVARLTATLLGSLAWTGRGHHTDKAVMLGLSGLLAETIDPDDADRRILPPQIGRGALAHGGGDFLHAGRAGIRLQQTARGHDAVYDRQRSADHDQPE